MVALRRKGDASKTTRKSVVKKQLAKRSGVGRTNKASRKTKSRKTGKPISVMKLK